MSGTPNGEMNRGATHVGVRCRVLGLVVSSFCPPGASGLSECAPVPRQVNHLKPIAGPHAA